VDFGDHRLFFYFKNLKDTLMIKCVLFDLDGVLADATEWHYRAFNKALTEVGLQPIPYDEHLKYFNGLPTATKLEVLRSQGIQIDKEKESEIRHRKQRNTVQCIGRYCVPSADKIELIGKLKNLGLKIGVCTNAVRETLDLILAKKRLHGFDITLSNQDVRSPKPSPDIYLKAMGQLGVKPDEVLIIEDSPKGQKAAMESGAHVMKVSGYIEVTPDSVLREVARISYKNLQILIPMAGRGSRFVRVGYTLPKPIIPILGKTMIQHVIGNLDVESARWFFVCLKEHLNLYNMDMSLGDWCENTTVIPQDGFMQGAACSASLAFEYLDKEAPLMLANSDQFIDMNIYDFLIQGVGCDGTIMTFKSEHPKWSYAKINGDGYVTQIKEKTVISNNATSGVYLWNRAGDFIDGVGDMIAAQDTYNNEYYCAPSYNYCIKRGGKYRLMEIKRQQMWGLGTPEDLIKFVDHYEE